MTKLARVLAQEASAPTYDTGEPCKHGHLSPRYTKNGVCVTCAKGHQKAQYDRHKAELNRQTAESL